MSVIALTIAGSDSGGGAGIQADLKTFSALGVYGASVVTAITAQNTHAVTAIHDAPASIVRAQIDAVLSDLAVGAVKIGMLSRPETIAAVADGLEAFAGPVALDPVMVATSGDRLLAPEAIAALTARLLPRAQIVTPNLYEAAALLDAALAADEAEMARQAEAILDLGPEAVLIKGGHGETAESVDLLIARDGTRARLAAPRIATRHTHGTGCTLSAAIAAGLAKGLGLEEACRSAKSYVTAAIAAAERLRVGRGRGPTHHFHAWW